MALFTRYGNPIKILEVKADGIHILVESENRRRHMSRFDVRADGGVKEIDAAIEAARAAVK
jgi:hypothetical protein